MTDIGINMVTSTDQKPEKKKKKKPDLPVVPIKNTADYQRMKLERLMANPDKPVVIPMAKRDKNQPPPPEFVRNVMGSSAGAGSGEFHVYRHLRRKEYARQKTITEKAKVEELDDEFQQKLEDNKRLAEEKTAKKRAKRLKRKEKLKNNKKAKTSDATKPSGNESSSDDDDSNKDSEEDNKNKTPKSNGNNGHCGSAAQKNGSSTNNKTLPASNKLTPSSMGQSQQDSSSDSD